jgi:dTDP-4-dehydrorhamnose reductase
LNDARRPGRSGLELWGGVECTINRVGNDYFEQIERTGHSGRLSDFERFAALGITSLRHAVLWERVAPNGVDAADWNWSDASLRRIRELAMNPVVGLLHHGSGPPSTDLLDPLLPNKLAEYATAVARRYPWVQDYTPVNEPLTTARFSCLYGHWYPHQRQDLALGRALLNQCRAVVLSMRAIREVNSSARLIQTDDLGKAFSTPKLAYQAEFENARRWASYDLLCGSVNSQHPLWSYLLCAGIQPAEIEWFLDNPCPPDVVGVNHYLSSERFLDEHLDRYPEYVRGSNGTDRYADVLAARVLRDGAAGPRALLMEAWERYKLPLAITECHNGCTREEQLRWFLEVWHGAEQARLEGADVVAVTAWSLLGAFDWNSLVTRNDGCYEPGIYDIRAATPRPTALATLISDLSSGREPKHPVLKVPGWWRRPQRLVYGFSVDDTGTAHNSHIRFDTRPAGVRPILITGARGTLGRAFARICELRGLPYYSLLRSELDITDRQSVRKALFQVRPWAIINAAGYVRVDDAELEQHRCYRENTEGPAILAEECAQRDIPLLTFSTDLVFGGKTVRPYLEADHVDPVNYYGLSKAEAEHRVLACMPSALIVRTSAFFGPWDEHNFVTIALRALAAEQVFRAAEDVIVSPTYVPDLVNTCLDLLIDAESGIWHMANAGEISWASLAENAANLAGVSSRTLRRCAIREFDLPARRPDYSALGSARGLLLPDLDHALRRFLAEREFRGGTPITAVQQAA